MIGSGCSSVGRVIASNIRGPWFESSHRQYAVNCIGNKKIEKVGNALKRYSLFDHLWSWMIWKMCGFKVLKTTCCKCTFVWGQRHQDLVITWVVLDTSRVDFWFKSDRSPRTSQGLVELVKFYGMSFELITIVAHSSRLRNHNILFKTWAVDVPIIL